MTTSEHVRLLERIWKAALNFAESIDEGQVEAYGADELKALNNILEKADFELGDPRITKAQSSESK